MKKLLILLILFSMNSCQSDVEYSGELEKWIVSSVQPRGSAGNGLVYIQTSTKTDYFFIHNYNISQFVKGDTITVLVKTVIPEK